MSTAATTTTTSSSGNRPVIEPTGRMILPQQSRMDSFRSSRDFEKLKSERERLKTFSLPPGWPVSFITREECAKAGFFFLQDGDKVQCAFCRGVAGEWEEGDNPASEHRRHFPRCPFVCNLPVGNIPIGHGTEEASNTREHAAAANGVDVCGHFPLAHFLGGDEAASIRGAQPLEGNMNDVATSLAIQVCGNGPAHRNLVTYEARLQSFGSNWPSNTTGQTPQRMAEAGFAYLGHLDHVKCFYCDGGLRNWEPGDDAWLEHARWFPHCSFLLLNKGDSYVKEVARSKPPVAPPQFVNKPPSVPLNRPRRVSDQEIRDLIDTPIVQAALEMGMELSKVKAALQRKIQQTGQPFLTTEALLDAVLRRDPEYESDNDTDYEEDPDEDQELRRPRPQQCPLKQLNVSLFNGLGSVYTSEASSSSSSSGAELSNASDDESPTCSSPPRTSAMLKPTASRTPSGDSGVSVVSSETEDEQSGSNGEESQSPISTETTSSSTSSVKEPETTPSSVSTEEENKSSNESLTMEEVKKGLEMEEELRRLREVTQCKICMDNRVEVVFLPCGHLVSCTRCATAISMCAVCRQPIKAYVKTYLS